MGNTPAKESRAGDSTASHRHHRSSIAPAFDPSASSSRDERGSRLRNRSSRNDIGTLLGIGPSTTSRGEATHERRETKAEREARRLERERLNRVKEREKSLREEHVDGGYLVTMGVYVGPEDFSKLVVRQLQVRSPTETGDPRTYPIAGYSFNGPFSTILTQSSRAYRLKGNLPLSGEDLMISQKRGPSIKSSPLREASPSLPQTKLLPTSLSPALYHPMPLPRRPPRT